MFAVENWPEDWAAPRQAEAAQWLDDALDSIVALTEDDTGKPEVCIHEDGPPSTSQARVEAFGETIWAVYDLRQLWKSMGPRVGNLAQSPEPGRNILATAAAARSTRSATGHGQPLRRLPPSRNRAIREGPPVPASAARARRPLRGGAGRAD